MKDELHLEVVVTFMNLARSGECRTSETIFSKMREIFPELTNEELVEMCRPAITSLVL